MFYVVDIESGEEYCVYGVKQEGLESTGTYFLIYDGDRWLWVNSQDYAPLIENN